MISNQSFAIRFIALKNRTQNGKVPIIYRITINGERAEGSTNRLISLSLWDRKAQKAIGKSDEAREVNIQLDAIKTSLHTHQSRLVTLGKVVTAHLLKNEHLGITIDRKSLCDSFDFLVQRKEELQKKKKLSETTVNKYKKTYSYVKSFIKKEFKRSDIQLSDVPPSFIEDFAHYLLTDCDLGNNTAMKKIAQAKSVFIMAHGRGWMPTNPAALFKCSYEDVDPLRLEIDELHTIITKEIDIPRLSEVRDSYVFMCFTGYAYADALGLTNDNIFIGPDGNQWITKDRQKTDTTECVPLFPPNLSLIRKYQDHPYCQQTGQLLPIKSNQNFNAYLKEIAAICGIKKELTTHSARHTFATTVTLENGVPLETVSKMLGHKSIKTTQKYAKVTRKKIKENMETLKIILFGKKHKLLFEKVLGTVA